MDSEIDKGKSKTRIHDSVRDLSQSHFIHVLSKQQKKAYLARNDLSDLSRKVEGREPPRPPAPTNAIYVSEEVDNTVIHESTFADYQLAPGYVKYTQDMMNAWNYILANEPDIQDSLDDISTKLLQILKAVSKLMLESQRPESKKIVPVSYSKFTNMYCENCGTNHEARDFLHTILLKVLDQFENSVKYIEFMKEQKVVNAAGYDLYGTAEKNSKGLIRSFRDKNKELASGRNLSKVRIIAINEYLDRTYFLALKRDKSYILGTAETNPKIKGITEDTLIEYNRKELYTDFRGELPFLCKIEHIDNKSPRIRTLEDDGSIPRFKDIVKTDIREINVEDELYYIKGEVVSHSGPDEVEDVMTGILEIQDRTGKIQYIKMPYDSGWRREAIKIGTWVEAIGIYKPFISDPRTGDTLISKPSLYAPYKVEFFRPFFKLS